MRIIVCKIACLLSLLSFSPAASANLLGNSGFETHFLAGGSGVVGNWTAFRKNGAVGLPARITTDPFEGARHLALSINGVPNTFTGLFQPLDGIVPGNDYKFSIWAKRDGLVSGLLEYRIEWVNAQGQFVGSQFSENLRIGHLLNDEYQWFQNQATAPAGAIKARAVVAAISTSRSFNLRAYIDSASFTAIPEPSSAILLALVGMLLPPRRLRHNVDNTTEDLPYLPE